jgi:hypothetical protein
MNAEAREFARDLFAVLNRLRHEGRPLPRFDKPQPRPIRRGSREVRARQTKHAGR